MLKWTASISTLSFDIATMKQVSKRMSYLEEVFLRFPLLTKHILGNLDDQSLIKFNELSKELHENDTKERIVWIRIIKKNASRIITAVELDCFEIFRDAHEAWKEIVRKTPSKFIKKLANCTEEFYKSFLIKNIFKMNWFPIHVAAQQGDLELCQFIFEKIGNRCPKEGSFGPLGLAAKMGHLEVFKFLSQGVNDLNQGCDGLNWTTLHSAAFGNQYEMCQYIISKVEDTNPKDKNGRTPLHLAAMFGHLKICTLIIKNTSDKNPGDSEGKTPLHLAADFERADVCRLLISNVIDKNPSDARGWTPLHYASARCNEEICFYLHAL